MFERNLEALVRRAALPVREGHVERGRVEFLKRLASDPEAAARTLKWRMMAMMLSVAACGMVLWATLAVREPQTTTTPASPEARLQGAVPGEGAKTAQETPPVTAPPRPREPRTPSREAMPRDATVTLTAKVPKARDAAPALAVEGTATFPDRTQLVLSFYRMEERFAAGRLVSDAGQVGSGMMVRVERRRFEGHATWGGPGMYLVTAGALVEDPSGPRIWKFEFPGWGDDLMGALPGGLVDLDEASRDAAAFLKKFGEACGTEVLWAARKREIGDEGDRLLKRLVAMKAASLYPAAHNQIVLSINGLLGARTWFKWKEGKLSAESYHADGKPIPTFRGEPFAIETYRKYVEEVPAIAGREFALWGVKELRRPGAKREPLLEALKLQGAHAGTEAFAERLREADAGALDGLEAEIRGN